MMEHHSDGEDMGITELELLRVLLPRTCEYCTGWMRPDPDDPGERVCISCGRSDFCPTPEVLAEPPSSPDPIRHLLPHAKRTKAVRGPAEGRLVRW